MHIVWAYSTNRTGAKARTIIVSKFRVGLEFRCHRYAFGYFGAQGSEGGCPEIEYKVSTF